MRFRGYITSIILLLALLLAACGGQPTAQPKAANEAEATEVPAAETEDSGESEATTPDEDTAKDTRGTLRVAYPVWQGGAEKMDPSGPFAFPTFADAMPLVYDTLVRLGDDWQPAPDLATDWESNEDATVWTFTLRDDVTFHDGKPLTSADVAYTFEHILDPDVEAMGIIMLQIIDRVETPDDYTAVFHLNQPHADFPILLTGFSTSIIPDGSGDTIAETGIGTGPFKLETLDPTGTTRLVANDDYWQGKPALAAVEFIGIPESSARLQALQAGQIDLVYELTPQEALQLATNSDIAVSYFPSGVWVGFVMLTDTPPFDDARVRKAMRLVVDRQELLDLTNAGKGSVTCDTPVWQRDPYYWDGDCPQDIEQARALLAEAGYADGLDVTLYTSNILGQFIPMAEVYQQQAADAGINVTIEQVPPDSFYVDVYGTEPFHVTGDIQSPADVALQLYYGADSPLNVTRIDNPELTQLLLDARAELDAEARKQKYQAAQELLFEESGLLVAYHVDEIQAYASSVSGVPSMNRYYADWYEITKTE